MIQIFFLQEFFSFTFFRFLFNFFILIQTLQKKFFTSTRVKFCTFAISHSQKRWREHLYYLYFGHICVLPRTLGLSYVQFNNCVITFSFSNSIRFKRWIYTFKTWTEARSFTWRNWSSSYICLCGNNFW